MREYSKIFPQIWIGKTGKQIKSLGVEAQLLAYYLMSCPHATMLGIYYLPTALIVHETGLSYEEVSRALQKLIEIEFCSYDEAMEYVWVHNMAFYQVGFSLKPGDHRVKNMNEQFKMLPNLQFIESFFEKYQEAFYLEKTDESIESLARGFEASSKPGAGTGERTRTETGAEESNIASPHDKKKSDDKNQNHLAHADQAKQILDFLNEKSGILHPTTQYNLNIIMQRLKAGATLRQCFQIVTRKSRDWKGNKKMAEFLRPSTLFNESNFDKYVSELVIPKQDGNNNETSLS